MEKCYADETLHECPVCMETVKQEKMVMCKNGHRVCEKHQLERIRAIYQEGRTAFGGFDDDDSGEGQKCFMCRCNMGDHLFSDQYFRMLRLIQAIEIPKLHTGQDWFKNDPDWRQSSLRVINKLTRETRDEGQWEKVFNG